MATTIDPLLTTAELSAWIGVPPRTLDQWAYLKTRGPRFVKAGGQRRYDRHDVEAWLAANKHGGTDAAS